MNYPGTRYTKQMMETVCYPAMEEVAQELRLRGAYVELKTCRRKRDNSWGIWICWCIWAKSKTLSIRFGHSNIRCRALPTAHVAEIDLLPAGNLPVRRQRGNDLMDYSKEQVITDILDQYERHLNFIHLHREAPGHSVMFPDA